MKKNLSLICLGMLFFISSVAQDSVTLNNLSFFRQPPASWRLAADVKADLNTNNVLMITDGAGVLVNLPDKKKFWSRLI